MRISDWSSDVCSSDLNTLIDFRYTQHFRAPRGKGGSGQNRTGAGGEDLVIKVPVGTQLLSDDKEHVLADFTKAGQKIGRASCRERVCQYVSISVVAVALKKKNNRTLTHVNIVH